MAKRKGSGVEVLISQPWPVCIALGLLAYIGFRYGVGWYLTSSSSPVLVGVGNQAATGIYAPLGWMALGICWASGLISFLRQRSRRRLLDKQTGLDSLRAMSWREFEMLVGEAFRRRGYAIQETGLDGPDGGIDLILRKDGKTTLVQCKQWKTQRVDVKVVREMFGLLAHHDAAAVKIVAVGDYTTDAQRFAQGKPIELIHGEALLAMVREGQTPPSAKTATTETNAAVTTTPNSSYSANPVCPKCGSDMVQRSNRRTKDHFWGCAKYPACWGTKAT
jgi:restriction system protein